MAGLAASVIRDLPIEITSAVAATVTKNLAITVTSNGGGGQLPAGVTLSPIDGETLTGANNLTATTNTHSYYTSHGFTNAASSSFNSAYNNGGWDDPRFFPIVNDYSFYPSNSTSTIYLPATSGQIQTTALGGTITVGSGPWSPTIDSSCSGSSGSSCAGTPLVYFNDPSEQQSWNSHDCVVNGDGFVHYLIANTGYTDPTGRSTTYHTCQLQTGFKGANFNGPYGGSNPTDIYFEYRLQLPHYSGAAGNKGFHVNLLSLGTDDDWPCSGDQDIEFFGTADTPTAAVPASYGCSGFANQNPTNLGYDASAGLHTYGWDQASTSYTAFIDQAQVFQATAANQGAQFLPTAPGVPQYPRLDIAIGDSTAGTPSANAVACMNSGACYLDFDYFRAYKKVTTGACYASSGAGIPNVPPTTMPHV